MGRVKVLWCWIDVPWLPKYLPPDTVDLKILSMKGTAPSEGDLVRLAAEPVCSAELAAPSGCHLLGDEAEVNRRFGRVRWA